MHISRRSFLSASGTVLAIPATPGSHAEAQLTMTQEATMEITRVGTCESEKGTSDHFCGAVRIDRVVKTPRDPARTASSYVTFEPGSRTAWHTHPLGQTLIITAGCGWVQQVGGQVEEVHPGDVVWIPAWQEALARCNGENGHDPHRDPGAAQPPGHPLAGTGERRTVSQVTLRLGQDGSMWREADASARMKAHREPPRETTPKLTSAAREKIIGGATGSSYHYLSNVGRSEDSEAD